MHWNVPPGALPGSATFVRVLDRWLNDWLVMILATQGPLHLLRRLSVWKLWNRIWYNLIPYSEKFSSVKFYHFRR
jgi:hypothetical protein